MNPLERITLNIENFTKLENEIGKQIINSPEMIDQLSIVNLGKKMNVSKSALIRFSQKIGYNGFSEFKFELSRLLLSSNINDNNDNNITSITSNYVEYINRINSIITLDDIKYISKLITEANRIKILGINKTGFSASQLRYRLSEIGFDAEAISDRVLMYGCIQNLKESDLCIIFSITGSKFNYINLTKILKENKTKLIVVSMEPNNPLKSFCDKLILLPYMSKLSSINFLDDQAIFFVFIEILLAELRTLSNKDN